MTLSRRVGSGLGLLALAGVVPGVYAMEIPPVPDREQLSAAATFSPDDRIVATHYFYWYRWPDEHFFADPAHTHDLLRQHFPDERGVSYESAAWHRRQMKDLLAAGIDVVLLVYWGAPNQYEKPDIRFSVHGIPPLVEALDELAKEGKTPRIGMFYDTSTLLANHAFTEPREQNVDLRTDEGKDIFYRTIRDFFCLVPPRHWACIDGRPLVQLYESAFATGHDQSTIDYVYKRFAEDFDGRRPFVVAGPAWSFTADARTGWGAALFGPILGEGAAQVGPGYDDSPVPGRNTPTRDRLGGGYYAASWLMALQAKPRLVIIETWSEMHEGTPICESVEDGRFYIDLTRRWADLFKANRAPEADDWSKAVRSLLGADKSKREGREFAARLKLSCRAESGGKMAEHGLRVCPGVEDGPFETTEVEGTPCVRTRRGIGDNRYLYFDIADPYYYDHRGTITMQFTYWDAGREPIVVHYDRVSDAGSPADRYRPCPQTVTRTDTKTWKTAILQLTEARCANGQNGGADFRFHSPNDDLAIREIEVSKLPIPSAVFEARVEAVRPRPEAHLIKQWDVTLRVMGVQVRPPGVALETGTELHLLVHSVIKTFLRDTGEVVGTAYHFQYDDLFANPYAGTVRVARIP